MMTKASPIAASSPLKKVNIALDRKVLADLATNDPKAFSTVVAEVRR